MRTLTNLLSFALDYPSESQRELLAQALVDWKKTRSFNSNSLSAELAANLEAEIEALLGADLMEIQIQATDLFDLGKGTSLRLFEHIHGDSRSRGQAMVDLVQYYSSHGLELEAAELPDHLAVILEAATSLEAKDSKALLVELGPILELLCLNHQKASSPWIQTLKTVYFLCGGHVEDLQNLPTPQEEKEDIDAKWAEPEISFGSVECKGA